MILEAIVKKTEKGATLGKVGDKERHIIPIPGNKDYSNLYYNLREGEKVFVNSSSGNGYSLVTNFDSGMEDFYFQKLFGNRPPRRKFMSNYQKKVVSALNKSRGIHQENHNSRSHQP